MKCVLNRFVELLFLSCCAAFASLPSQAISGPEFAEIKEAITKSTTQSIALKEPTFTEKQINDFGDALGRSGEYLTELKLWNLKATSKKTELLFKKMESNKTVLHLVLSGSYLSDDAVDALINLLSHKECSNLSVIEKLHLNGVTASYESWKKIADAIGDFKTLRVISLKTIKKRAAPDRDPETFDIGELLETMAASLSETKKIKVNISGNIAESHRIDYLRKETPHLVKIINKSSQWSLPTWVTLGFVGAAGYIIGSFGSGSNS